MNDPGFTTGRKGISFDLSINLGHVLTIATLLCTLAVAYATYLVTVNSLDMRLRYVETHIQNIASVNYELTTAMHTLRQDVAIIRDRIERDRPR